MSQLGLSDSNTHIIDLTSSRGTVESLTETKLMCSSQEEKVIHCVPLCLSLPLTPLDSTSVPGCIFILLPVGVSWTYRDICQ